MKTFAPEQKAGINDREGNLCAMEGAAGCRIRADHDPNHRQNRSRGGDNATSNGCAICGPCNIAIEAIPELAEEARRRGVKVSGDDDPERVPIWLPFWRQWCLLVGDACIPTGVMNKKLDAREADEWMPAEAWARADEYRTAA